MIKKIQQLVAIYYQLDNNKANDLKALWKG